MNDKETVLTALRTTPITQIKGQYWDGPECACAMGVIYLALNPDVRIVGDLPYVNGHSCVVTRLKNIPAEFERHVVEMNDTGASFKDIADMLEANWK